MIAQPITQANEAFLVGPFIAIPIDFEFREKGQLAPAQYRDGQPIVACLEQEPEQEGGERKHPEWSLRPFEVHALNDIGCGKGEKEPDSPTAENGQNGRCHPKTAVSQ